MRQKPSLKPGVSCLSWVWLLDNARARALLPPVSLGQQFPGHIQDPVQQGGAVLAGLAHNLGSFSRMHRKPPVGRCQRIERAVHVEFRDQDRNRLDFLSQFRASGAYVRHFACTLLALCLHFAYTTLHYTILYTRTKTTCLTLYIYTPPIHHLSTTHHTRARSHRRSVSVACLFQTCLESISV